VGPRKARFEVAAVTSRIFKLFYLILIAVAMVAWSWMIFQGLAWALDI